MQIVDNGLILSLHRNYILLISSSSRKLVLNWIRNVALLSPHEKHKTQQLDTSLLVDVCSHHAQIDRTTGGAINSQPETFDFAEYIARLMGQNNV